MGRRKTSISDSTLEMIVSIDQRLTELIASDIPKRLHCIEEKLDYINPRLLTIEHVDRFYSEVKTVLSVAEACDYLGITEYNDHVVRIRTKCKIVEITGNELGITFLHDEHMLVEGHIQQIQFLFE